MAESKKAIPLRLDSKLRKQLEAEKERTDAPFQKIIERALREFFKNKRA